MSASAPTDAMKRAAYDEFENRRDRPFGEQVPPREAFAAAIEYLFAQMGLDNEWVPF